MVKVHEVWNFERGEGGLFADYVDAWLKIKTEASGWPVNCETEEEKQDCIERFEAREGIRLEYENVKPNPGLKAMAKLMLNSFWGKFGERTNKSKTEQCTSPQELYNITEDDTKQVQDIRFCTEDVIEVVYAYKEDSILQRENEHCHFLLYNLMGTTQTLFLSTHLGRASPVLRHRLGDLPLEGRSD